MRPIIVTIAAGLQLMALAAFATETARATEPETTNTPMAMALAAPAAVTGITSLAGKPSYTCRRAWRRGLTERLVIALANALILAATRLEPALLMIAGGQKISAVTVSAGTAASRPSIEFTAIDCR